MTDAIEPESRYLHKREGYEVETSPQLPGSGEVKTKDADAATWSEGVAYIRLDEPESDRSIYVRAKRDFLAKFEPLETASETQAEEPSE